MVTKYFIVSLPRTGTTTIARMGKIVGLRTIHCPGMNFDKLYDRYDLFSDTPIYRPSVIDTICNNEIYIPKFIYIKRDFNDLFKSWVNVNLYSSYINLIKLYNNNSDDMSPSMLFDYESYNETFSNETINKDNYNRIFTAHKNAVIKKINEYNKDLLIYDFNDGWDPFCDFVGVDIPNTDIPVLNKDKMFDPY